MLWLDGGHGENYIAIVGDFKVVIKRFHCNDKESLCLDWHCIISHVYVCA